MKNFHANSVYLIFNLDDTLQTKEKSGMMKLTQISNQVGILHMSTVITEQFVFFRKKNALTLSHIILLHLQYVNLP